MTKMDEKKIEKREIETRKILVKKMIEKLANYFANFMGDEIIEKLGTTEDGDKYHLNLIIYSNRYIETELIEDGNYSNNDLTTIYVDLGRVNVYDYYDMNEAYESYGDDFDELQNEAYDAFRENFMLDKYLVDVIGNQLSPREIIKLYNLISKRNKN